MTKKQAMPYMKFWTSYLDDIRLNRLTEAIRWRYVQVYLLAFKADAAGELLDPETGEALTAADIAMLLRADESAVNDDLAALATTRLIEQVSGNTWRVTRYADEQVNQKEYRQAAAERKARSRENKQVKEKSSEEKESESELKEREYISQVKSSEVKRHNEVTRDERVTNDDRLTDKILPINSKPEQEPREEELTETNPYSAHLAKIWNAITGESISPYMRRKIDLALHDGIDPEDIQEKIERMELNQPRDRDAYFTSVLNDIYPKEALAGPVLQVIEFLEFQEQIHGTPSTLEDLNAELKKNGWLPITIDQLKVFKATQEEAEEQARYEDRADNE